MAPSRTDAEHLTDLIAEISHRLDAIGDLEEISPETMQLAERANDLVRGVRAEQITTRATNDASGPDSSATRMLNADHVSVVFDRLLGGADASDRAIVHGVLDAARTAWEAIGDPKEEHVSEIPNWALDALGAALAGDTHLPALITAIFADAPWDQYDAPDPDAITQADYHRSYRFLHAAGVHGNATQRGCEVCWTETRDTISGHPHTSHPNAD